MKDAAHTTEAHSIGTPMNMLVREYRYSCNYSRLLSSPRGSEEPPSPERATASTTSSTEEEEAGGWRGVPKPVAATLASAPRHYARLVAATRLLRPCGGPF